MGNGYVEVCLCSKATFHAYSLHHMTCDRCEFETFKNYNENNARFGNDASCLVKGKGLIKIIDKIIYENAYYVEGLKYNLLSVSQLNWLGCKVEFN